MVGGDCRFGDEDAGALHGHDTMRCPRCGGTQYRLAAPDVLECQTDLVVTVLQPYSGVNQSPVPVPVREPCGYQARAAAWSEAEERHRHRLTIEREAAARQAAWEQGAPARRDEAHRRAVEALRLAAERLQQTAGDLSLPIWQVDAAFKRKPGSRVSITVPWYYKRERVGDGWLIGWLGWEASAVSSSAYLVLRSDGQLLRHDFGDAPILFLGDRGGNKHLKPPVKPLWYDADRWDRSPKEKLLAAHRLLDLTGATEKSLLGLLELLETTDAVEVRRQHDAYAGA